VILLDTDHINALQYGGAQAATLITSMRRCSHQDFATTIITGPERDDKTRWGRAGQTSTQVVVLSRPPRSWIYLPLGQSDRPQSPHYRDQSEKAFSPRKLRPSLWLPEDLAGHIESRTVLERSR
jgi:hypothetical protein